MAIGCRRGRIFRHHPALPAIDFHRLIFNHLLINPSGSPASALHTAINSISYRLFWGNDFYLFIYLFIYLFKGMLASILVILENHPAAVVAVVAAVAVVEAFSCLFDLI